MSAANGGAPTTAPTGEDELERSALAAEVASLRAALEDARATQDRSARRELLLTEIAAAVEETPDLESALMQVSRAMMEVTGFSYGDAWLPDPVTGRFANGSVLTDPDPKFDEVRRLATVPRLAVNDGPVMHALVTQAPLFLDMARSAGKQPLASAVYAAGLRSAIILPMVVDGRAIGTLGFFSHESPEEDGWCRMAMGVMAAITRILERRLSAMELHRLFTLSVDMQCVASLDGTIRRVNPAFSATLGVGAEALKGVLLLDLLHVDDRDATHDLLRSLPEGRSFAGWESRFRAADGTYRWLSWNGNPVVKEGIFYVTARDISDRKRSESELRESEERYRTLFDGSPIPMWIYERQSLGIIAVNGAACQQYGYARDELQRMTLRDMRPPEQLAALEHDMAENERLREAKAKSPTRVVVHRKKDGALIDVEVSSHDLSLGGRQVTLSALHDVTEKQELEMKSRQSQKMEAMGRLAGGIAHDFNNILTGILGSTDFLDEQLGRDGVAHEELQEIVVSTQRAADLTRQLLAFSRQQVLQPRVLNLNGVVRGVERLLARLIGEHIELRPSLAEDLGTVRADPGQLEQVIVNLAVNARDAMPRGGRLTIETSNFELGDRPTHRRSQLKPGAYVRLAVGDTGVGMDEVTQALIFEPFFTTKEVGKGTGLGLSTVYGIVDQSGGEIRVVSALGVGTVFEIYLPRVAEVAAAPQPVLKAALRRGGETLLVAEDEPLVRKLTVRILEGQGYRVLQADSGTDAVRVAAEHPDIISLLVTDVVMPGLSGPEVAAKLAAVRPAMRVLYLSGYTGDDIATHGVVEDSMNFLQKPFSREALIEKVGQILDEPGEPPAAIAEQRK